eukprot:11153884-Prorocentrum_lima.AAC.1
MAHRSMYPHRPIPDTPALPSIFHAYPHDAPPPWTLTALPDTPTITSDIQMAVDTPIPSDDAPTAP